MKLKKCLIIMFVNLLFLTNIFIIKSEEKEIVSIEEIQSTYSFNLGEISSLDELNLPNVLNVTFNDDSQESLDIVWNGDVDFNKSGVYQLTASFVDEYTFEMPTIKILIAPIETKLDAILSANNQYSITTATIDTPAVFLNNFTSVTNTFLTLIYNVEFEGLKPNTQYVAYVDTKPKERVSQYYLDTWNGRFIDPYFTTDEVGNYKGRIRYSLWSDFESVIGEVTTTLYVYNTNDSSERYVVSHSEDKLMNYILEGFDVNETRLIDPTSGDTSIYTTIPINKNDVEGKELDLNIKFYAYHKNADFKFVGNLVKIEKDENNNDVEVVVSDNFVSYGTSDSLGNVNSTMHLTLNDLDAGKYYTRITAYVNENNFRSYYSFNQYPYTTIYVYENKPTEAEVPVDILTLDDNNIPLENAKVVLRKNNQEGQIVDEWTSQKQAKRLYLSSGIYYLEETSTPSPFIKPKSFTFELKKEEEITSEESFVGHTIIIHDEENDVSWGKIVVFNDDLEEMVYCISLGKDNPELINKFNNNTLNYYQFVANGVSLRDHTTSTMDPDELYLNVSRVIYNGYPNNASNIKEKYNLNDMYFESVTQAAIHYYTDNGSYNDDEWNENCFKAFNELLSINNPAPKDMVLNVYVADYGTYQNLIGSSFKRVNIIEINYSHEREKPDIPGRRVPDTSSK